MTEETIQTEEWYQSTGVAESEWATGTTENDEWRQAAENDEWYQAAETAQNEDGYPPEEWLYTAGTTQDEEWYPDEEDFKLNDGQIALLETIKPIAKWRYELSRYFHYDGFDAISETFWQHSKHITFDQFYYTGVDQTPKIEKDDPRFIELDNYRSNAIKFIVNTHYHGICNRMIKDFVIGLTSFEDARETILHIISLVSNVVSYDYARISNEREKLNREIYEAVYHPNRITKWIESGNDIEDYLN